MSKLSLYQVRHANVKHYSDFNKWSEICHIYTEHNIYPLHFNRYSALNYKFIFYVKWLNYPISIISDCYLKARLRVWTVLRNRKKIKNLSFYHDRLFYKIEVSAVSDASLIGLSNVSTLQQNFL